MKGTRKSVLLALLVAQAMILSIVENLIPVPQVVPGVKLGLANIITLVAIVFFDTRDVLAVVGIRCILSAMFGGGIIMFLFSITGGMLSALVMLVMYKRFFRAFSLVGISVTGSIFHNIGQLTVASILFKEFAVFTYLPLLLVSAVIMGCFVGICSSFLIKALKKTGVFLEQ